MSDAQSLTSALQSSIANALGTAPPPPPAEGVTPLSPGSLQAAINSLGAPNASEAPAGEAGEAEGAQEPAEVAAAAPPEAPEATAEAPAPAPDPQFDARFAKLAKSTQKLVEERQKFAEERNRHTAELKELARWKEIVENAKEDPVSLAELAGIAPDLYATALLEKGSLDPTRKKTLALEKEVQSLRSERKQEVEAAQARQEKQQIALADRKITEFVTGSDKFQLIKATNSYADVRRVIENHWDKTVDPDTGEGEILPFEKAAEVVENYLDKQIEPLLQLQKIKSRLSTLLAGEETPGSQSETPAPTRKSSNGTITSKMRAGQAAAPAKKELSEAERYQALGDWFKQQMTAQSRR